MSSFIKLTVCLVIFLLGNPPSSRAQAVVIDYQTQIHIEKNRKTTLRSYLIQINDKDSDYPAEVEISYNKNQKVKVISALILDAQGKLIREIKRKDWVFVSKTDTQSFFEDSEAIEIDMRWHQFPYQIRYSYEIEENEFLYISYWSPLVYTGVATLNATLDVFLPPNMEYNKWVSEKIQMKESTEEGQLHLSVVSSADRLFYENFSPNLRNRAPFVKIVPLQFVYEKPGSQDSWAQYGFWQESLLADVNDLPDYERVKIHQLIQNKTDTIEKIRTLYHYLQDHTRYINVTIDKGGLKPYPASYVCFNKYGDCKALTVYMKALLAEINIPSYYTKIYADEQPVALVEEFPSQQFNHVILSVPLSNQDTLWLENTSAYLPFNYLGTFTQGRQGLLVKGLESKLVRTPALDSMAVKEEIHFKLDLRQSTDAKVDFSYKTQAKPFESIRYYQHTQQIDKELQYVHSLFPFGGINQFNYQIKKTDRDSAYVLLEGGYLHKRAVAQMGQLKYFSLPDVLKSDFDLVDQRKTDFSLPYPIFKIVNFEIELPAGYNPSLPLEEKLNSPFGTYLQKSHVEDNTLFVNQQFFIKPIYLSVDDYPKWHQFLNEVKQKSTAKILLKKSL